MRIEAKRRKPNSSKENRMAKTQRSERAELDTAAYEATYGHSPRGRGGWLFYFDEGNEAPAENAWCPGGGMTYADAKKRALQRAAETGARLVTVAT
jgi:hypothetical protein